MYEVTVKTERDVKILGFLEEHLGLDIWSHPGLNKPATIMVPKEVKKEFEYKLNAVGLTFKMEVENIRE